MSRSKPILILSKDMRRAQMLARSHMIDFGFSKGDFYFVRDINDLRGISNCTLLLLEGYDERKDWPNIRTQLEILSDRGVAFNVLVMKDYRI